MGMLAWVIMGLALWHFTIWLPDRFWGGIVGAFLASIVGAIVTGIVISEVAHGVAIPGRHATHIVPSSTPFPVRSPAWRDLRDRRRPRAWRGAARRRPVRPLTAIRGSGAARARARGTLRRGAAVLGGARGVPLPRSCAVASGRGIPSQPAP